MATISPVEKGDLVLDSTDYPVSPIHSPQESEFTINFAPYLHRRLDRNGGAQGRSKAGGNRASGRFSPDPDTEALLNEYYQSTGTSQANHNLHLEHPSTVPAWVGDLAAYMQNREPLEPLLAKHSAQLDKLEILNALMRAEAYLKRGDDGAAKNQAIRGLEIAQKLNHHPYIARCEDWLDRIEQCRRGTGDDNAGVGFGSGSFARSPSPEVMPKIKGTQPTVPYVRDPPKYQSISTQTPHPRTRLPALVPPNPASSTPVPSRKQSDKRKMDQIVSENYTFHFSYPPNLVPRNGRTKARSMVSAGKRRDSILRPKYWVSQDVDTGGTQSHWEDIVMAGKNLLDWDLSWVQNSAFRPSQGPFTFRMEPDDMASRWRQTNIFPEQEWEYIMPLSEWEAFKKGNQGKHVSMGFLAEERCNNPTIARKPSE